MRTIFIFFIILLLASCNSGNSGDVLLPALDHYSLYPALFNAEAQNEWCLWKPTKAEKDSSNVSWDGYCHTRLDTVLNYIQSGITMAVVIFGTYEFDVDGIADCHACAPTVSVAVFQQNTKGYWRKIKFIKNFGPHGSWGHQPDYSISTFNRKFFLTEDWAEMHQGITETWKTFWHLPSLVESIEINGFDDSGWFDDAKKVTSWNDSINDASSGNLTKVIVKKKGVVYEEGTGQIQIDSSWTYVLIDSNIFRPVKSR